MEKVISAFAEEHVEKLTGVSRAQLRHWDRSGFYLPSFADSNRSTPFSRVYSFKDIVALRVLNSLRNQFNVSLQHLREVSKILSHLANDKWTGTRLWVLNKKVVWQEPGTGMPQEIISGQYVVPVVLEVVVDDTKRAISQLNIRDTSKIGKIEKSRYVGHNAPVFAGTRIPVAAINRYIAAGYSSSEILKEYPDLNTNDIEAAKNFNSALAA
ncbi:MAG: DUF433 domain-containing protein [Gammaproteobacteria bacterium]|nr:DUF433 domain-containing protein [Gammaproteobacteria bacterium]